MREAVIVEGVRTAIAKGGKSSYFANVRWDELGATVIRELLTRTGIDPEIVDDLYLGLTVAANENGYDAGRLISVLSGLSLNIPGVQLNRFCASGLVAVQEAAANIMCGWGDVIIAAGGEHMTRCPATFIKQNGFHPHLQDYIDLNGLVVGHCAEVIAREMNVSREAQDQFAMESHQRAAKATAEGKFKREIIPIEVEVEQKDGSMKKMIADTDQGIRGETTMESLAKLQPLFAKDDKGTVTAGNAAQVNDAAAAVMVMEKQKALELGLKPRLKLLSFSAVAMDPLRTMWGPIYAVPKALARAGLKTEDIDVWEINEAFASQIVACMRELKVPREKLNMWGSGISLGHPLGCTGTRQFVTLMNIMDDVDAKYGVVSMCAATGQGGAAVVERIK